MKTHSDAVNVCLITNRGCNLRCKHCYIEPELLANKNAMSDEDFRLVHQRTLELFDLDNRSTEINLECVGGEPTFLPYEFWERNLPHALVMAQKFAEKTGKRSPFIFNTNLVIADPRYFDLFEAYDKDDNFELFISWESDTHRYGSRDKLYKKYVKGIEQLGTSFRTLSVVVTKGLIDIGAQRIIDEHVIPHGFQDIAVAMLFQFGSGKTFFDEHMPTFRAISQFYIDLAKALPRMINCDGKEDTVTMSPYEEVKQSLLLGRSYHFMGNDHFDLEVEPDGSTSFNSSMTGSEAQLPSRHIHITDDLWSIRVLFENTPMLDKKLNGRHDFCRQCKFQRYCLGGYYHYKLLDKSVIDSLSENGQGDCPGYKKLWEHVEAEYAEDIKPVYEANFYRTMQKMIDPPAKKHIIIRTVDQSVMPESLMANEGYVQYLKRCLSNTGTILMDKDILFGKTIDERLWYYDSLGISVRLDESFALQPQRESIIRNVVYGNFRTLTFSSEFMKSWLNANSSHLMAKDVGYSLKVVKDLHSLVINDNPGICASAEGLYVDDRNTELFQWAYFSDLLPAELLCSPLHIEISEGSLHQVEAMVDFALREQGIKAILNAQ